MFLGWAVLLFPGVLHRLPCIVSPLHRLSPAPSLLHRLPCTVSPTPPLRIVSPAPLPFCLGTFSLCAALLFKSLFCTSPHTAPLLCILLLFRTWPCLSAARLRGALSVCGCERKETFSSARKRAEACRYLPPPRREDLFPAPAGGQCIPFPCRQAQKKSGPRCEVRSSL